MKNFLEDNWFKIIIAVAILILAISVGYYFIIYIPCINEQKVVQKANQAMALQKCLNNAKTDAERSYLNYCLTSKEYSDPLADCPTYQLPTGGTLLTAYETDRDDCFKQYPQN